MAELKLISWLTLLSSLIAWRVIYIQQGWINDDSVLYFEMARLFSLGEWSTGNALFNWPFYPALLAGFHLISGASFQLSAQIFNIIFFAITTFSFLSIIRLSGGNQLTILCGALLLLSSAYIVGDILPMLLRDQGFWAFFLSSIYFFIQFYRQQTVKTALLWQSCALIAVLFRIEAVTFLIFLPFIFLIETKFKGFKVWALANCLVITIAGILLLSVKFHPSLSAADLGRANDIFNLLSDGFRQKIISFNEKASVIGEQVLGGFLHDYSMLVLIVGLLAILAVKSALAAGWVSLGLFVYKFREARFLIAPDALKIFYWLIALALINATLILFNVFVLSGRYIISLSFILLILCTFCLALLFKQSQQANRKILLSIILAALLLSFFNNLLPKNSAYNYEQQAVAWLKNTEKVDEKRVFYVSPRARYYAGAPYQGRGYDYWTYTQQSIADKSIYGYDYLLINLNKNKEFKQQELILTEKLPHYRLIHTVYGFKNKKKVLIYKKVS